MGDIAILLAAAFVAGALNAVAGGGSFLTLPALVFTGVPPVVANATGTVALLPGYAAGAWGFKDDMQAPPGLSMKAVVLLALIGGAAGATLGAVTTKRSDNVNRRQYYDERAGRYYYYDSSNGRYYWEDGSRR